MRICSRARPIAVSLVAAVNLTAVLALVSPAAAAPTPAADCQPYSGGSCLFPFPDNRFTRSDRTSPTGRRVDLPAAAMPVNTRGSTWLSIPTTATMASVPAQRDRVHVPGLDNQAASPDRRRAVDRHAAAFAPRQPIVIIDEATGRRQLIWSELDANAKTPGDTELLIHPGKNFPEGHTYVVALRRLRAAGGQLIPAPRWFARLRTAGPCRAPNARQRSRYARIFAALGRARHRRHAACTKRGTSRRLAAGPDAPHAGDPQRCLRPARRPQPRRQQGRGPRPGVHQSPAADTLTPTSAPGPGQLHRARAT